MLKIIFTTIIIITDKNPTILTQVVVRGLPLTLTAIKSPQQYVKESPKKTLRKTSVPAAQKAYAIKAESTIAKLNITIFIFIVQHHYYD